MRNTHARLSRLEGKVSLSGQGDQVIICDWTNDPYYLSLPSETQNQFHSIMEKLRPLIDKDAQKAFDSLSLEELDVIEGFYVAFFERNDPEWLAQVRNGSRSLYLEPKP